MGKPFPDVGNRSFDLDLSAVAAPVRREPGGNVPDPAESSRPFNGVIDAMSRVSPMARSSVRHRVLPPAQCDLTVERLWTDAYFMGQRRPMSSGGKAAMPGNPRVEAGRDCLE